MNVTGSNPLEKARKSNALQSLNDDLTADDLEKLVQLKNSKKGLDYLQNKWFMLKTFLKI